MIIQLATAVLTRDSTIMELRHQLGQSELRERAALHEVRLLRLENERLRDKADDVDALERRAGITHHEWLLERGRWIR